MGNELSRHVERCELESVAETFEMLEDGRGDALGGLALVIAWEHTVDVGAVHSPEASSHVHGEWVARWDDEDALTIGDASCRLYSLQFANYL